MSSDAQTLDTMTFELFLARHPDLADSTQVGFDAALAAVRTQLSPARWGMLYDLGLDLAVAHTLALDGGGAAGPVASKRVEGLAVAYDTTAAARAGWWGQTGYGLRFLALARTLGAGGLQR